MLNLCTSLDQEFGADTVLVCRQTVAVAVFLSDNLP